MVNATGPVMSFLRVCRGVSQGRVPPALEASASFGMKTAPIEAMRARLGYASGSPSWYLPSNPPETATISVTRRPGAASVLLDEHEQIHGVCDQLAHRRLARLPR